MNTSVINKHLNKIAKYDNESLPTVFIVVYCNLSKFEDFGDKYDQHVSSIEYQGFRVEQPSTGKLSNISALSNLWTGEEIRYRNNQAVRFYHILINFKDD